MHLFKACTVCKMLVLLDWSFFIGFHDIQWKHAMPDKNVTDSISTMISILHFNRPSFHPNFKRHISAFLSSLILWGWQHFWADKICLCVCNSQTPLITVIVSVGGVTILANENKSGLRDWLVTHTISRNNRRQSSETSHSLTALYPSFPCQCPL